MLVNQRTALYDKHLAAGGQMVPFGGWDMPLHYGSQIDEHHAVRRHAGVFDVSHMAVVDLGGANAAGCLQELLANDVAKLDPGQALYSCMLNEHAGVVDDLIVYRRAGHADTPYRLVVNAGTTAKDLAWIRARAARHGVEVRHRQGMVMLAVQGPAARELAAPALPAQLRGAARALKRFHAAEDGGWFVGRTGYTGEDGWEIIAPAASGVAFWDALCAAGVRPCGLGARDTLRLEAGMNLYGQDMDEETSPLASGLGWTIAWDPPGRRFVGREALERERAGGVRLQLAGLVLKERGVMRRGQTVQTAAGAGEITSGGFSPTIGCSIALARVPAQAAGDCEVSIRDVRRPARLVRPPFVRNGRVLVG
jgi:aminomethyltransferase